MLLISRRAAPYRSGTLRRGRTMLKPVSNKVNFPALEHRWGSRLDKRQFGEALLDHSSFGNVHG